MTLSRFGKGQSATNQIMQGGTARAKPTGIRFAEVTAIDPEKFVVKVKVPSVMQDGKEETWWSPVMQPMMGSASDYGYHFLPEVGDQVIVGFLDGDFDKPLVLGGCFTQKTKAPKEVKLSDANTAVSFTEKSNDGRAIISRAHSHLLFWDKEGEEAVELRTKAGHILCLNDKGGEEKIQLYDKDRSQWMEIDVPNKKITIQTDTGEMLIKAAKLIKMECEDFHLVASKTIKVESGTTSEWDAGTSMKVTTGSTYDVEAGGNIKVQGPKIDLNP